MAWGQRTRKLPAGWRTIRARVLQRDGYRCTMTTAGQRCTMKATEVDHYDDRDDHTMGALRSLCANHHAQVTATQAARAQGRWSTRRRDPEPHPGRIATGGGSPS